MTRRLSVHADVSVRSPAGTGRIVGSGSMVRVAIGWRFFLALLLDAHLRRNSLQGWRFLESRGIAVHLDLPGLPAVNLDRLAFAASLGVTSTVALLVPLLLA